MYMQCVYTCVHHIHMCMNAHTWVYIFAHRSQGIVYVPSSGAALIFVDKTTSLAGRGEAG